MIFYVDLFFSFSEYRFAKIVNLSYNSDLLFYLVFDDEFYSRHLNIGAGRVVWQDIVRIDFSIKKKQFHKNPAILASCKRAKEGNGRLHALGLVCVLKQDLFSYSH